MYGSSYKFRHYIAFIREHGHAHTQHVTRHTTPSPNILSTAPQFSVSQKALGTISEDGNVMPKHVGATIHN
jgi:hypothetical protein